MPILAVALLLTAAVTHATWNFFAKGASSSASFIFLFTLCGVLVYLPVTIGVVIWTRPTISAQALLFMAVAGLLNGLYFVLLSEGYKVGDLSVVYPLARGTGPALAVVGAIIIFGERPSPLALAGAAMVVVGIIVMSWGGDSSSGADITRSVVFALATGAIIATYSLWDSKGVTIVTPALYLWGLEVSRALLMAPFAFARRPSRDELPVILREQRRALLIIGILSPGAYLLVLVAYTLAPVSYVAPAREISILFGAILGLRLLGESDAPRRLAGATAIVAGVFALALG
jgi:drug/metabolite transporter (DMT)-like permease